MNEDLTRWALGLAAVAAVVAFVTKPGEVAMRREIEARISSQNSPFVPMALARLRDPMQTEFKDNVLWTSLTIFSFETGATDPLMNCTGLFGDVVCSDVNTR